MLSNEKVKTIPAGTPLYHNSSNPDELVASGAFDSSKTLYGRVVYLTDRPVIGTNTEVTLGEDVKTFDIGALSDEEFDAIAPSGDKTYAAAQTQGFDGRTMNQGDPMTRLPDGGNATEVAIFEGGVHKLAQIRRYQGE